MNRLRSMSAERREAALDRLERTTEIVLLPFLTLKGASAIAEAMGGRAKSLLPVLMD